MNAFSNLKESEKILLILASVIIVAMAFYLYLWEPTTKRLQQLRTQAVPQSAADLAWAEQAIASAGPTLGKKKAQKIQGKLLTVIEQVAQQSKIKNQLTRIQPAQNGETVKVWFENVIFDDWVKWVDNIKVQGIKVQSAGIVPEDVSGYVSLRATVGRWLLHQFFFVLE